MKKQTKNLYSSPFAIQTSGLFTALNSINAKFYSTTGLRLEKNRAVKPLVVYFNCELEKSRILTENKDKAVVYRWVNNINNKTYIGISINLPIRLHKYYSVKHLAKHKTPIHNTLLKYGFENFTLEILEYCENGINLVVREQYYLDLLKPEYNILGQAGSSLGFKHKAETLEFFYTSRKASEETKQNLSLAATGRVLTEEDKKKISDARKGINLSNEIRAKISAAAVALRGVSVTVKNVNTNEQLEFTNLTEAAKYINVSRTAVKKYLDTGKLVKNQYIVITKIK